MFDAIRAEALKLSRRRMVVVFGALVLLVGIAAGFGLPYVDGMRLPGAVVDSNSIGVGVAGIFILVIGASAAGWEYKNHTLATMFIRQPNRVVVLGAKAVVVLAFSILFSMFVVLAGAVGFGIHAAVGGAVAEPGWTGEAVKHWLAGFAEGSAVLFSVGVLGMTLAVVVRSTGFAVAAVLGYIAIAEPLLELGLNYVSGDVDAGRYLYGRSISAFAGSLTTEQTRDLLVPVAGAAVFAAWTVLFMAAAALIWRGRDVN